MSSGDHFRYYIVLQTRDGDAGPASLHRQTRRVAAFEFVKLLREWVAEQQQAAQVSALDVTMFGQIQITCAPEFIDQIRQQDILAIAEIRPANSAEVNLRKLIDQISG